MIALDIIFYVFVGIVLVQLFYYLVVLRVFAFLSPQNQHSNTIPVSVIVCAKNEAENLKAFLPAILNQDYPNYQVVLINDASHDDTLEVIEHYAELYPKIKIVNVKNTEAFWANKKYALTLGIKAAKHNHLLFTDADCKPVSSSWISEMSAQFNGNTAIVLGYGAYAKIKKSFLNKLIRFETVLTASQYFSYAKLGMPYMGVGRNLAYTKPLFFEANGFISHMNVRSGDDDLFVNQMATSKNTAICHAPDSFTESLPKQSYKAWINQKRRHVTTAKHYKAYQKFILGAFYTTQLLFWILALTLITLLYNWPVVTALIAIRIFTQWIVLGKTAKKLKENDLIYIIPLLEVFLIVSQLTIFISNSISKPNSWK
ncbi:glycosyltransferase [Formosa sp. S-31]|uniref:glycosyltransferase n=1 Tax=Formosa sp. S-31 TaxID=2790949 RepID=UPI003EB79FB8